MVKNLIKKRFLSVTFAMIVKILLENVIIITKSVVSRSVAIAYDD